MPTANSVLPTADEIVSSLRAFIEEAVRQNGGATESKKPGHRKPFHWPPHPISYAYHVLASDWSGKAQFESHGETFDVEVAKTPHGVFGRCNKLWHEAKGDSLESMLENLKAGAEPLFNRQFTISRCLGRTERFQSNIGDLPPQELVRLLYCEDRDIAHSAKTSIETHASLRVFGPALVEILKDRRHPNRRTAQWCVLDLFEDLQSFCPTEAEQAAAVSAIRQLIWEAEDDYARTIYKAGVVVGGHFPAEVGGDVLLHCLKAPSRIGRRSAMHGLFHVVEWDPASRARVVAALQEAAETDPEPLLRDYAAHMASDIERAEMDHILEPSFPGEA